MLEKIIKGFEVCIERIPGKYTCKDCPYEIDGNDCEVNMSKDAIALLKEQNYEIQELRSMVEFWKEKALHT